MLPRVGGDLLGRVSLFQRVSGGTQLLLVAEGRHHRGQGLKDGRGVLHEEGALLFEMGETGEGSGVIQMVLALETKHRSHETASTRGGIVMAASFKDPMCKIFMEARYLRKPA